MAVLILIVAYVIFSDHIISPICFMFYIAIFLLLDLLFLDFYVVKPANLFYIIFFITKAVMVVLIGITRRRVTVSNGRAFCDLNIICPFYYQYD